MCGQRSFFQPASSSGVSNVEYPSPGRRESYLFLIDRHFNELENIFSTVFLFHAICVTPTAHYSDRMVS